MRTMLRRISIRRGIVLAIPALVLVAACTPPMPPDVLAAKAEASIVCQQGTTDVSVPSEFTGTMAAVGDALTSVCPEQSVVEVSDDANAPVRLVAQAPSAAQTTAFAATCPSGGVITVPAFAYPVTLAYNLPGLEGIVLSPAAVAGILNGTVTQWSDPLIASENADFGLDGLPAIALVSAAIPQGAVDAMTTWLVQQKVASWTDGVTGTLKAGAKVADDAALVSRLTSTEGALAVLPIFQAVNNNLAMANLLVSYPAESGDQQSLVVTADDIQLYKVGSGATTVTRDPALGLLASPAVGGVPVEGNFDLASSKIVLGEGQPLVGWPVLGYAHLMVCDAPDDAKPLAFAQYLVRLAGQGSLEAFGVTPMPEPVRIRTFEPLKVTLNVDDQAADGS